MNALSRLWGMRWVLRSIFSTLYFNFRCLPFSQACRLPVILYKPHFLRLTGKVRFTCPVRPGLVQLGTFRVPFYPNNGIKINLEGTLVIGGNCMIGNDCCVSVGKEAILTIGNHFYASTALKLACTNNVEIEEFSTVGWDCIITDSDFHKMTYVDGGQTKGYGEIHIGKNNWIATRCTILKNTITPDYCTVSASTTLCGDYTRNGMYTVIGSASNIETLKEGVYLDRTKDQIVQNESK